MTSPDGRPAGSAVLDPVGRDRVGEVGLGGGTFAARLLTDAILGRKHEWASRFTPSRVSPRSTPEGEKLVLSSAC